MAKAKAQQLPRYPIYIPTRGRHDCCLTARFLRRDGVPFFLVVEEPERDAYAAEYGDDSVLVLPFRDQGIVPVRNWIKDHSVANGDERHWQIDDNIRGLSRFYKGKRLNVRAGIGLSVVEDFADRYENVALAGLNYEMFLGYGMGPFTLNAHVYSITLMLNSIPNRFRGKGNEDVDMCLQVLADGWCTVLINAFMARKMPTMKMKGGNMETLYDVDDSRLKVSRRLERKWPGVVSVDRRFGRPHHVIKDSWKRFDTKLKRKPDVVIPTEPNERGMVLRQVRDVKSEKLKVMLEEAGADEQ